MPNILLNMCGFDMDNDIDEDTLPAMYVISNKSMNRGNQKYKECEI
jgi:hypothetical protein